MLEVTFLIGIQSHCEDDQESKLNPEQAFAIKGIEALSHHRSLWNASEIVWAEGTSHPRFPQQRRKPGGSI